MQCFICNNYTCIAFVNSEQVIISFAMMQLLPSVRIHSHCSRVEGALNMVFGCKKFVANDQPANIDINYTIIKTGCTQTILFGLDYDR